MDISLIAKIAAPIAGSLANIVAKKGLEFINKTDIQKAIETGIKATAEKQEQLPLEERLFYSARKDGLSGYDNFLNYYLTCSGVLAELQKPLTNQGKPNIEILTEIFKKEAKTANIKLTELGLPNWIKTFVDTYFQNTNYIRFKVAKTNYFQQLEIWFDNVSFAGISNPTQEDEIRKSKSNRLVDVFVMPDVKEEVDKPDFFLEETPEKLDNEFLVNTSIRKFLASELLSKNKSQNKPQKFVILGDPGSGKTTLMSYFAIMLAQEQSQVFGLDSDNDWLPILIRIRDFVKNLDKSILEHIRLFAKTNMTLENLPTGFFEHWLEDGRALILLDGLDEVAEESKRYEVVRRIETFLGKFDKNPAIITSRPVGYRRDFFNTAEFPHYQMQSFDDEKISAFLDNWYNSRFVDPQEAQRKKEDLQKALGENDRIKLLARNPLLLTIIALIHRYEAVLPKQRNKLYEKAVDTLLLSWDKNKELNNHQRLKYLDTDDLKRLMESLAYCVHTQGIAGNNEEGGTVIEKEELIENLDREIRELREDIKFHQAKEERKRFLELIQGRTGLLNEQGQDYYSFVHKTFQEYLCAKEIDYQADNNDDFAEILQPIREHLHDAHWREVLLLLIGLQKPKKAARAVREIFENQKSEYEKWLHRDLLFAGYCLAENPKGMRKADGKLVQEVLEALVELEVSKEEQVGDRVRSQVFQILCSLGETDFERQALEMLKGRSDLIDEKRLWRYQVKLGEKDRVISLFVEKLLENRESIFFFLPPFNSLLHEISEDVVNAVLPLLRDDNSHVRGSAADALGKLGKNSEEVVNAVLPLLRDKDSDVRGKAALALGYLGKSSEDVVNAVLPLLRDDDSHVRAWAAFALGKLDKNSEEVVNAVLLLLRDDDSHVRSSAAFALENLDKSSEEVVNAVLLLLRDDDYHVRWSAANALGDLGKSSEEVVNAVLLLLRDDDYHVRWSAANALGKLGKSSEEVVNAVLLLLRDDDYHVRGNAAFALGKLGKSSEEVVNALLPLLRDDDSHVRWMAANALGKLDKSSEEVVNAILPLLRDDDSHVRAWAAFALGKLGKSSEEVVNAILPLLRDDDSHVRGNAAFALGKLGKKSDKILPQVIQWIQKNQDSEYLGTSIDLLWDLVVGK